MSAGERQMALTFDMDGLEVLSEGYGVRAGAQPSVYATAVPRMLDFLAEEGVRATFFVVAQDARDPQARAMLRRMVEAGHEVGNHSLRHRHLLGLSAAETRADVEESTSLLEDATGGPILGYRGPSLTLNEHLMELLLERGYRYDSTLNPTWAFIGEWLYLSVKNPSQRNAPDPFFLRHALAPAAPYRVAPPNFFRRSSPGAGFGPGLWELPISHARGIQVPYYPTFHFLFPFTRGLCRWFYLRNRRAVFLAHGLDFLDLEADGVDPGYRVHPGMKLPWSAKRRYFHGMLADFKASHRLVTALEMAEALERAASATQAREARP